MAYLDKSAYLFIHMVVELIILVLLKVVEIENGEGEDSDEAYRERDKQASDFFQEEKWIVEEGLRAFCSL